MRTRMHAIATSMIAAVVPFLGWLSTVIVTLVCLRQGAAAGGFVLLWTLLPVGVGLYLVGDPSPLIALLSTFVLATLLRQTMSWELVLLASVVLAALGTLRRRVQGQPGAADEHVQLCSGGRGRGAQDHQHRDILQFR